MQVSSRMQDSFSRVSQGVRRLTLILAGRLDTQLSSLTRCTLGWWSCQHVYVKNLISDCLVCIVLR